MANVNISNKLPQELRIAVKNISGTLVEQRLAPFATAGPFDENDVGEYTNQLAKLGHVRIRTAS